LCLTVELPRSTRGRAAALRGNVEQPVKNRS
jgi:hypothetical protein